MTPLVVTGWSALSAAGSTPAELAGALRAPAAVAASPALDEVGALPPGPAPRAISGFDLRQRLGRKGTSLMDRWTGLSVVTCGAAISDAGLDLDALGRERIGVVLGTTTGGLKSTSDYSRETLAQPRPYLVNPGLFPNTVMNSAPGRVAIWYGLKGVNSTIAGGPMAFLQALRYATVSLGRRNVDALLVGAVEELSEHRAWVTHVLDPGVPVGEGAGVFVLMRAGEGTGHHVEADLLAVATGFGAPGSGDAGRALANCCRRALASAGVGAADVRYLAGPRSVTRALAPDLGASAAEAVDVTAWLGDCGAASGALGAATLLAMHREDPALDGAISLLVSESPEGAAAAAVLRGWSRQRADHR